MADWIFQADHLVDDEVARQPEHWWNTPHHRGEIAIGDRVWLQVSGQHSPGLYYVATVVRPVYESTERVDRDRPSFGRWRTDIRFEYRIVPPLSRSKLLRDPQLESFQPFRGFQGSNRPVPMAVSSKLLELANLVPLATMTEPSEQISGLLHEAGETHHRVFRIVDGADDDWASWYAQWLIDLSELPDLLGARPVRSELIYMLVSLDKQFTAEAPSEPWEIYYARQILRHFQPSRS